MAATPSKDVPIQPTKSDGQPGDSSDYIKDLKGTGTPQDPWQYTNQEGLTYVFDLVSQQWVLKESEAILIAQQQAIYGQPKEKEKEKEKENEETDPIKLAEAELKKKKKEEKKRKKKEKWQAKAKNPNVYVSGVPLDMKEDELGAYFAKCGVLKKDPETAIPKVKIYRAEDGTSKGDAIIGYFREESVDLALNILDGTEIRPGFLIKVVRAEFQPKAEFVKQKKKAPSKKVKRYNQKKGIKLGRRRTLPRYY